MKWLLCTVLVILEAAFSSGTISVEWIAPRDGRFFGQTVTKLLVDNLVVTSVVPSSCVAIEPSLPACRGFRFLNFGPASTQDMIIPTQEDRIDEEPSERRRKTTTPPPAPVGHATPPLPPMHIVGPVEGDATPPTTSGSWGGYFNFMRGVTVTKTATRLITETVIDRHRVITFSVKHCLPSKLPFELPHCKKHHETPVLGSKIVPTETVSAIPATAITEENMPILNSVSSEAPPLDPSIDLAVESARLED